MEYNYFCLYLWIRVDGILIDGRTAHEVPYNPYALGHKINHPPSNHEPNVFQVGYILK